MNVNEKAARLAHQAKVIYRNAEMENREPTPAERGQIEELLAQASDYRAAGKAFAFAEGSGFGDRAGDGSGALIASDAGQAFVQSEGYKKIADPQTRGQRWTTGAVPVGSLGTKAGTLLQSDQGAGLVPPPQIVPGVVETLFQPLEAVDLFGQFTTASNSVRYAIEGTAISGAAGVAEGGEKPASDITLSLTDEPVRKIATSITVSDELLADAASAQSFVGQRLSLFVKVEEERQLLRGTAGGNELVGIVNRSGVNTYARGTADNNAVCLAKVIANTRGSANLEPDAIIMHPLNWLATRLLTDTAGQFFGAGPFGNSYGNAGAPGLFGEQLWGKRVALSTTIGAGTALVGSFGAAAAIARRGGATVEATNSHLGHFTQDLVAIRSEQREALCCYRPGAFTVVSGLSS